jgi:hypothetical protein
MKLWHVIRSDDHGYDEYSDFVAAAEDEEAARLTHPDGNYSWMGKEWQQPGHNYTWKDTTWPAPGTLNVKHIGEAAPEIKAGVICSSFHAG